MPLISPRLPVLLLLPLLIATAGCDRQGNAPAQPPSASAGAQTGGEPESGTIDRSHHGAAMPTFSVADPGGARLSSADLKGKAVLVNLWATWCAPCVAEMPQLDALAEAHHGKLTVVTISQDSPPAGAVGRFMAAHHFAHLQPWLDPDNKLGLQFNTGLLPTSVLYDAQGHEVWRTVGGHDWSTAETAALIEKTIGA